MMMATRLLSDRHARDYALLVTDDDEHSRDRLCEYFDHEGYRTFRASSGREAVEIAKDAFLHFLILNIRLPDFSGIETFRIITQERQSVLPCIFTSADATKEQKLKALSARAHAFVPKPIDIQIIRVVVDQILDKYYAPDCE